MWQTSVGIEIDIPSPLLEFLCCTLAPLVLYDRIAVTVTHEDLCVLKSGT